MRNLTKLVWLMSLVVMLAACGGGGSSTTAGKTTADITGSLDFPAAAVPKQAVKAVGLTAATNIILEVFSVEDGTKFTSAVTNVYIDSTNSNSYSYTISGIPVGKNFVFKAKRGNQVLRRYLPTVAANMAAQNVDTISTATVLVIQNKLSITTALGEAALPAGVTITRLTDIKPTLLESTIRTSYANNDASYLTLINTITASIAAGTEVVPTAPAIMSAAGTVAAAYTPPTSTSGEAVAFIDQAKKAMEAQDFANAAVSFEAALAVDPANKDANFGGAFTKMIMMLDDPKVKDIFSKWSILSPSANQVLSNASPVGNPFKNWTSAFQQLPAAKITAKAATENQDAARVALMSLSSLRTVMPKFVPTGAGVTKSTAKAVASLATTPATAPTVGDMQVFIANTIIPALTETAARLKKVEGTGYAFTLTKTMQGNPYGTNVSLNDGEIYAMEAALNAFIAMLNISVSYNLDVYHYPNNTNVEDYKMLGQDPLKTINQPTFFTLKAGGQTTMNASLDALKNTVNYVEKAYNSAKTRVAGQGAYDLTKMTAQNRLDFESALVVVKSMLNGRTTVSYNNNTKSIDVDITKFFTNPLTRNNAPTLGYDLQPDLALSAQYGKTVAGINSFGTAPNIRFYTIDSNIVPMSDLPDYTLNGILPANVSTKNIDGYNGILPVISGKLLPGKYSSNGATDGTSIYFTAAYSSGSIYKLDPVTGTVSSYASGNSYLGRLFWNGSLHSALTNYQYNTTTQTYSYSIDLAPVTISNGTYSIGAVYKTITLGSSLNVYLEGITAHGNDIYYALSSWYPKWKTEIRKIDSQSNDTLLFTVQGHASNLSIANNYIYAGDEKHNLTSPYSLVATYGNMSATDILLGGYFYSFDGGKLIKKAGTPSGGAAKVVSSNI